MDGAQSVGESSMNGSSLPKGTKAMLQKLKGTMPSIFRIETAEI